MPSGFYLGALAALALLGAGLAIGWTLARLLGPKERRNDGSELQPVLSSLVQFTSSFSQDVSEYRTLIDAAAHRAQQLSSAPQRLDAASDVDSSVQILAQIIQANEQLKQRLADAESSLQGKSAELRSYMTEARTDALTGLPNRRAWDDELGRRLAAFRRQGTPVAVLLVDVDRFKQVNDRYGHNGGDAVLQAVANSLRQAVRDSDLLTRYGGEEFAVLLSGASEEEFTNAAERVRQFVEQLPVSCAGQELQVTISGGIAAAGGVEEAVELMQRADEALYASKSDGRNCVHWHDGRRSVRITPKEISATTPSQAEASAQFRIVCAELRRKLFELT
jgi:diguanylate cyclase